MGMLAKIRRMHLRDGLPIREISRQTGLSRNTIRHWLRQPAMQEPHYPERKVVRILDPWAEQLRQWLETDRQRNKRERRTAVHFHQALQAQGYPGGYGRVCAFIRRWKADIETKPKRTAYVPLSFALGEAFQFDWSCEYVFIGGLRRRIEVAHMKLCASRAFWLVAYPAQSHEMLFDAHARAFAAFGGIPRRGIYDNMKTAVDKVGRGKERTINARFHAMCGHYLFDPEFCNRAAGWEKGIVEKNVLDRRRQIWQVAGSQRWPDFAALNDWMAEQCRQAWQDMAHPEWPTLTLAELREDEQLQLLPNPRPFDGYNEQPVRVSSTALIHFQRNRYSVPNELAHRVISLRIYPERLQLVADGQEVASHVRSFERHLTCYDFRHYISLIERKPGALRNGAPFADMPEALKRLQSFLLKQSGGDRVMAQVLAAIPVHGLKSVMVAAELALESGRPSGEHVLNVLSRLKQDVLPQTIIDVPLRLIMEPEANTWRYDHLREVSHVR